MYESCVLPILETTSPFFWRLNKDKILLFEDVLLNYSGYHITIFEVENVYKTIISHASDFRKTIFNVYTLSIYTTKLRNIPRIRKSGTCQMSLLRLNMKKTIVCRFQYTQQFIPYTPPHPLSPSPPPKKKSNGLRMGFFLFLPTKLYVYILCFISCINAESKEDGKYQESIQLSTTPDLGHHMGSEKKHKNASHTKGPRG